ncbi:PilZ domain-containing protein [Erythrobacter oryzae]|uniref:PilZ domain-containing protein n=1 Tax=Erythrobacter oryzae TaxID=3019556 RepID=UPI002555E35E|nr:PilZ domain-containing protein [Erythrobacter sp. COR-2]
MADPKPQPTDGPALQVGRRSAPRLRLSLPAQLIAVEKVHTCILLNLSRTGAQVAILEAMREGEGAILRCGMINHFAIVTRTEFGLNALQFDEPLTDAIVLETRRYHENFEEREKRALIETARKWVSGETGDERPK